MNNRDDWLDDELSLDGKFAERHIFPKLTDPEQKRWESLHYSTRFKLEGSLYNYRMIQGAISLPFLVDPVTMWYRIRNWHLDALLFELTSVFDSLLQELNVACKLGLSIRKVDWNSIAKVEDSKWQNSELRKFLMAEYNQTWFKQLRDLRNLTSHCHRIPANEMCGGCGKPDLRPSENEIIMLLPQDSGKLEEIPISECQKYIANMTELIQRSWEMLKHY